MLQNQPRCALVPTTPSWLPPPSTWQGVLSGLFPGTRQPIPVHTTEEIDEILYTNVKSCRKLHTLLTDLQAQLKGWWAGGWIGWVSGWVGGSVVGPVVGSVVGPVGGSVGGPPTWATSPALQIMLPAAP